MILSGILYSFDSETKLKMADPTVVGGFLDLARDFKIPLHGIICQVLCCRERKAEIV